MGNVLHQQSFGYREDDMVPIKQLCQILACICICFTVTLQAQDLLTPSSLQGTWKLVSLTIEGKDIPATGYLIFEGRHYSFITNLERPALTREIGRKPLDQLAEAEKNLFCGGLPFPEHGRWFVQHPG